MNVNGYEVLQLTNHWRLIDGAYYRDAIARRTYDGAIRCISILDND